MDYCATIFVLGMLLGYKLTGSPLAGEVCAWLALAAMSLVQSGELIFRVDWRCPGSQADLSMLCPSSTGGIGVMTLKGICPKTICKFGSMYSFGSCKENNMTTQTMANKPDPKTEPKKDRRNATGDNTRVTSTHDDPPGWSMHEIRRDLALWVQSGHAGLLDDQPVLELPELSVHNP